MWWVTHVGVLTKTVLKALDDVVQMQQIGMAGFKVRAIALCIRFGSVGCYCLFV